MIDAAKLLHILGRFLLALAGCMALPLLYGLAAGDDPLPFLLAVAASGAAGGLLVGCRRGGDRALSDREGILLTVAVWLTVCLFGSLPFCFSPSYRGFTDAFFESVSGFTTTGATVAADVEVLPGSLQLWRCASHWIGGMGVVLLGVSVLPLVGIGGLPLYRADFPGARSEKLALRVSEAARALWKIYGVMTVAAFLGLRLAGMGPFDALCHCFSAVGTGGFSTRNSGVAAFDSPLVEGVLIVVMLLAGVNFTLHYRLWAGRRVRRFFSDPELRFYLATAALAALGIWASLALSGRFAPGPALRHAVFQACSVMTGTSLETDDYGAWPPFSQLVLLALMFIGGCAGSTTGGLKAFRILLLLKVVGREFRRLVERRGIFTVRLGSLAIPERTIQSLLNLVYLAFITNLVACLLLSLDGIDVFSGISAVAACMFNAGPGLGSVGPAGHYGDLSMLAKWVLSGCMLIGRLEFYVVLVLLTRTFWRH